MSDDDQKLRVRLVRRDGRRRYDPASKARLVAASLRPDRHSGLNEAAIVAFGARDLHDCCCFEGLGWLPNCSEQEMTMTEISPLRRRMIDDMTVRTHQCR
nr:hypothetical protein [Rhizobium leguminosarum]